MLKAAHTRSSRPRYRDAAMDARLISFGRIEVDGVRFDHDVVIARGSIRKRKKRPSKAYRDRYGHTPLSLDEAIPWSADRLIVGTGASGQLPIMPEVIEEADRRHVELVALPTAEACRLLTAADDGERVSAILHVTC
jgi:hypothetical protein